MKYWLSKHTVIADTSDGNNTFEIFLSDTQQDMLVDSSGMERDNPQLQSLILFCFLFTFI